MTFVTYDMTNGIPVNMDVAVYQYEPDDSPLLTGRNARGGLVMPVLPTDVTKVEWMDEERLTPRTRLAAALTTGETVLTVQTGERTRYSTGDTITIQGGDEHIQITGYGTTADTLLLTRGFKSTTAINYASGDMSIGIGTVLPEGSNPEAARQLDRVERYNVTQIFGPTMVDQSRTEQKRRKYGQANPFAHQVDQRIIENIISREQAHLYGKRYESTADKERTMAGFKEHISTNVDSTSTQITESSIKALQQKCYNQGGIPDILLANPVSLGDLNSLNDSDRVRVEIEDPRRGRMPVTVVMTEFGPMTVHRDRWCLPEDAFLYCTGQVIRRPFDPLLYQPLGKNGDSEQAQIVCEETQEFKGQRHAARFDALSYAFGF